MKFDIEPHPGMVHFPIALLVTAAIFEILSRILKRESLSVCAHRIVLTAAVTGLAAGVTGLLVAREIHESAIAPLIARHRLLALTVLGITIVLAVARIVVRGKFKRFGSALYVILLAAAAGLVIVTSWLGGEIGDYHTKSEEIELLKSRGELRAKEQVPLPWTLDTERE